MTEYGTHGNEMKGHVKFFNFSDKYMPLKHISGLLISFQPSMTIIKQSEVRHQRDL